MTLPDYPWTGGRFEVRPGIALHYLDEGPRDAEVLVMLHGNPSWSYYWRHLVRGLSDRFRCIVPDHIGMGLSDKPDDAAYRYTLASRVDDLAALLDHLGLDRDLTLVVHDWGGMIGFGWALTHAAAVRRLVILNTAAFPMLPGGRLPWQLRLARAPGLGAVLVRGLNLFAAGAARAAVRRPLPPEQARALVSPYDSWANRRAVHRFVQDVPLREGDAAWALVAESGRRLHGFADRPVFIGWGLGDFVFDRRILQRFREAFPGADVHAYPDAGHYVLEDAHERLLPAIRAFLTRHPL